MGVSLELGQALALAVDQALAGDHRLESAARDERAGEVAVELLEAAPGALGRGELGETLLPELRPRLHARDRGLAQAREPRAFGLDAVLHGDRRARPLEALLVGGSRGRRGRARRRRECRDGDGYRERSHRPSRSQSQNSAMPSAVRSPASFADARSGSPTRPVSQPRNQATKASAARPTTITAMMISTTATPETVAGGRLAGKARRR